MKPISEYVDLISFFAPALSTAAAVAIGGSQVGTFVLLRREGMMALALPQVVTIGVALSLRWEMEEFAQDRGWPLWLSLIPPLVAAAVAVILLAWSKRHAATHWLLPSLFVAGVSLSFLIIANAGKHVEELEHRLTGSDVTVTASTAQVVAPVVLIAGLVTSVLWRRWLALAQVPAAFELAGLRPARWDVAFLCLLTTVLMFGTSALGAVMVLAMLFLPPATVLPWARRIPAALVGSAAVALAALAVGFVLSNEMSWPFSHSVGGAGFAGLAISYGARSIVKSARG
jgi:ABC-type Mn2+/Zn2+ transport system permease subunit